MKAVQVQQPNTNLLFNLIFIVLVIFSTNQILAYESNDQDSTKDVKTSGTSTESIRPDMQVSARTMTSMKSDPDNDFGKMMIQHKKRAIELSEKQVSIGKDQETIQFAKRVINDQNREIEELNAFLKQQKDSKRNMSEDNSLKSSSGRVNMQKMRYSDKAVKEIPLTGIQDKDYISELITHHEKSIEKTTLYMEKSHDENVKKMAQQMIQSDKTQIADLKLWQNSHK